MRCQRPPQFGLQGLFLLTALCCFIAAMPSWARQMSAGLALGMALGFLLLIGVDIVQRR